MGAVEDEEVPHSDGMGGPLGKLLREAVGLGAVEAVAVYVGGVPDKKISPE